MQTPNVPVVVIVGAGASHAAAPGAPYDPAPLTNGLFEGGRATELLARYDLANKAARFIRREKGRDDTIKLEATLRALRLSDQPHMQHAALAVPLYLQELLLNVTRELRPFAERYDALTFSLSRLRGVMYVSLNYDTLLDCQLHAFKPLEEFDDYISPHRPWSLIKPHGSINWSYDTVEPYRPELPASDLALDAGEMNHEPPNTSSIALLRGPYGNDTGWFQRYPALAMPEGAKDELKLPPGHMAFFMESLGAAPEIEVLVLGYSAIDTEVLQMIKDTGTKVRRMTVVNRSATESLAIYDVIKAFGIDPIWPDIFDGSYAEWIDGPALDAWVDEYGGPYNSATDPEALRSRLDSPGPKNGRVVVENGVTRVPSWAEIERRNRENQERDPM